MDGAFVHKRMGYTVYILQSDRDGSFYIGHTARLDERLCRHNEGRSPYSRVKTPWKLIYHEVYGSRAEAMRRERGIKRMKSREYIERLIRASRV